MNMSQQERGSSEMKQLATELNQSNDCPHDVRGSYYHVRIYENFQPIKTL